MSNNEIEIVRKYVVTDEDIDDVMSIALDSAIGYWCGEVKVVGDFLGEFASDQISRGGDLIIVDSEDKHEYLLNKDRLLRGIVRASEFEVGDSDSWFSFDGRLDMTEIDDVSVDIMIQYAIFGEIVYG